MLGILDTELFPDDCEVVEMPLHNQWIYLVHKNGNSSLRLVARRYGHTILRNEQVQQLESIDVYVRNPRARYISGVNTFLQHLSKDHPTLDQSTAFWFAKRYKFLNRHYLPQFFWLQNLSRFINSNTKLVIRDFSNLGSIISLNHRADVTPPSKEFIHDLLTDNKDIEFWWRLDQILLDLAGQSLTWQEIVDHYKSNFPDIADRVLPKT